MHKSNPFIKYLINPMLYVDPNYKTDMKHMTWVIDNFPIGDAHFKWRK